MIKKENINEEYNNIILVKEKDEFIIKKIFL